MQRHPLQGVPLEGSDVVAIKVQNAGAEAFEDETYGPCSCILEETQGDMERIQEELQETRQCHSATVIAYHDAVAPHRPTTDLLFLAVVEELPDLAGEVHHKGGGSCDDGLSR